VPSRYPDEFRSYIDGLEKGTVMQAAVSYVDSQWMEVGKDLEDMYVGAITPEELIKIIADRRDEQALLQKDPAWVQ
jgi:raffinose/stachyose/melibiose transport system substrate-binding protein